MLEPLSPLRLLRRDLIHKELTALHVAEDCIKAANANASRNTYLYFDPDALVQQAKFLTKLQGLSSAPLFGVPISLKDCFDLTGTRTTCGCRFYAGQHAPAPTDSAIARRLKQCGALITGKTHLHPLAYGITGQNPDFGDCLQPREPTLLTGGSSSGAAASVQEGSAIAAIGTDTGGSIRVPAALCGLVGFRTSHCLTAEWFPDAWTGGAHLAPSFDTIGLLLRDPRDAALLSHTLFDIPEGDMPRTVKIGCADDSFLFDCEPAVLECLDLWKSLFSRWGAQLGPFDTTFWKDAMEIFAPIQAHEASILHRGNYQHFEAAIRDRLIWGASLTDQDLVPLRLRWKTFQVAMGALFESFDLLMLPASPTSRLYAGSDLSQARQRILRYTTPFSLAGVPALSLPGELIGGPFGTGIQIAAAPGADPLLLNFVEQIGSFIAR